MSGLLVLILRLLMAAALYAFVGVALWLMWKDISRARARAMPQRIPSIRLEAREPGGEPLVQLFAQPEVALGRGPGADVRLNDEAVSSRHALFSFHHGQWWIEDLGSTNGTRLNMQPLTVPTVLASGDEIACGQSRVLVNLERGIADNQSRVPGVEDE
jgi:FHA domain-containing protein